MCNDSCYVKVCHLNPMLLFSVVIKNGENENEFTRKTCIQNAQKQEATVACVLYNAQEHKCSHLLHANAKLCNPTHPQH